MPQLAAGPDAEATLRAAGEVFRAMVEGIRDVLISRAAIKNEFRVEQTMLRARDNNALKFSVTVEDALAAMLAPNRPGYKAPVAAAREAFADVRSHEMAVMAGVQTALLGLLRRFEPDALEKRLEPNLLGNILPVGAQGPHLGAVLRHLQGDRPRGGGRFPVGVRPGIRPCLRRADAEALKSRAKDFQAPSVPGHILAADVVTPM